MKSALKISAALLFATLSVAPALAAGTTTTTKTTTVTKTVVAAKPAKVTPAAAKKKVVTFRQIDTNHDGKITYVELKKVFPKLSKKQFAAADTDKSGALDVKELAGFFKGMK